MTATRTPRVVAIAAHKGGVGKTTTAMALAAGVARFHRSTVLLVDLDPQGHSTTGLGLEFDETRTIRELLEEDRVPLAAVTYASRIAGVTVAPATIRLEKAARSLLGRSLREQVLRKALAPAVGQYDWIVIDCAPSLGSLVENALVAATEVIVPCRSEARGADGLVDMLEVLELLNPPAHRACRILRTQRHGSRTTANALLEDALEPYRSRVLHTVIPQCDDLNHAQVQRIDIFEFAPRSTGAAAYAELAGEVTGEWVSENSTS